MLQDLQWKAANFNLGMGDRGENGSAKTLKMIYSKYRQIIICET